MSFDHPLFVFCVGVLAGIINATAGGGSMLVLPLLDSMGLGAVGANATNRLAVVVQAIAGGATYRRETDLRIGYANALLMPSLVGAGAGALTASTVDEGAMRTALVWIFSGLAAVVARRAWSTFRRQRGEDQEAREARVAAGEAEAVRAMAVAPPTWLMLAFLAIGFYGGFVQAGVGVMILVALQWGGLDLVRANAVKLYLIGWYTALALVVFAWNGQVAWLEGTMVAAGGVVGAILGARIATRVPKLALQVVLLIAVVGAVIRFATTS